MRPSGYPTDTTPASKVRVSKTALHITKTGESNGATGKSQTGHLEVRKLGLVISTADMLHDTPLTKSFASSMLPDFSEADDTTSGRRLVRLRGAHHLGGVHTAWIDPERGHSVVRLEAAGSKTVLEGLASYRTVMTVEPAADPLSGRWYFRSYKMVNEAQGKLVVEESATVREMQFDQGVDPKVFTLAGMDLSPGLLVREGSPSLTKGYWDGSRVVPRAEYKNRPEYQARQPQPVPVGPVPATGMPWWQWVVVVVLALGGALVIRRAFR